MTEIQEDMIGPRLKEIRLAKGLTLEEFYSPFTDHVSNYSSIENGNRKIGKRKLKEIVQYYRINLEYIQKGKGERLLKVWPYSIGRAFPKEKEREENSVPFYNVSISEIDFKGGIWREIPEYYVNYRPFNDCNAYLPIYGDSMYPKYASGEIIAIKEVNNYDIIQWGEAYLVVTSGKANNMATVKLVFKHSDENKLILRASNPNFSGDTVIDKDSIIKLYIVKGKISRNQL